MWGDIMPFELKKADSLFDSLSLLKVGALDSKEEFAAFYVAAAGARNAEEMDRTEQTMISIQVSPSPRHILYSGHLGCGKSTELRRLGSMLKQEGFLVGIGVCDENLDLTTVKYTDLILFILETLLRCAQDENIPVCEKTLTNIESYWKEEHAITFTDTTDAGVKAGASIEAQTPKLLSRVLSISASVRSDLRIQSEKRNEYRRKLEPSLNVFIGLVNDFIDDIRSAGVKKGFKDAPPIVLLDQLEKANVEAMADLFEKHSQDLVRLRLHLVIPFPIYMCYTPSYNQIKNYYSDEWIIPMIKLQTWDEKTKTYDPFAPGAEILHKIITKRMDESLFTEGVLAKIIEKTGGFLRDLFTVVYDAALNAVTIEISKAEEKDKEEKSRIEEKDMLVALEKLQSSISRMFPNSSRARLEKIKSGEKHYASDQELMVLMQSGAVFEYNGKRWVDLHPLVADWLDDTREIVKE